MISKQNFKRMDKIQQTYNVPFGDPQASFDFIEHVSNYVYSYPKEKKVSHSEYVANLKSKIPAVGAYNTDSAYKMISKSPTSSIISRRRIWQ